MSEEKAGPKKERYLFAGLGVEAIRHGCEHCGRGIEKVELRGPGDEPQFLIGFAAMMVWTLVEDDARRNRSRV